MAVTLTLLSMKTVHPQLPFASLCLGAVFCLAALPAVHGEPAAGGSPTPPPGPPKVRVMVRDNNIATTMGGLTAANAPAPVAAGPAKPGASPAKGAAAVKESVADLDKWTHTTKKSLTIDMVNMTNQPIDVNVKSTFLAKDETGKHEVMPEKTVENKVTLAPGKPAEFTTDEVDFTHTSMHRAPAPKSSGAISKNPKPVPMEPASGHAYFGYKVEVFQGNDLIGSAVSDNH
jgi:hypothetical protein